MNKSTLKALKGSIQKWHDIAYHDGEDRGTENCPLCQKFFGDGFYDSHTDCYNCPVREHTGHSGCFDTPYQTHWDPAQLRYARLGGYDPEFTLTAAGLKAKRQLQLAAIAELKFLVTLMPIGEQAEMSDGAIWYCDER